MLNIVSLRLSCIVFICPFHEWIIFLYWKWITYKLHLPCTSRLRWRIFEPVAKPWLRANGSLRFKNYFFVSSISTYAAFVMLLFTKLIESLCRKNKFSDNHHAHTYNNYIHRNKCTSKTLENYWMRVQKPKIPGLNPNYFSTSAFISNSTLSMLRSAWWASALYRNIKCKI